MHVHCYNWLYIVKTYHHLLRVLCFIFNVLSGIRTGREAFSLFRIVVLESGTVKQRGLGSQCIGHRTVGMRSPCEFEHLLFPCYLIHVAWLWLDTPTWDKALQRK